MDDSTTIIFVTVPRNSTEQKRVVPNNEFAFTLGSKNYTCLQLFIRLRLDLKWMFL